MMYHRNRLIKPYVRVGYQLKVSEIIKLSIWKINFVSFRSMVPGDSFMFLFELLCAVVLCKIIYSQTNSSKNTHTTPTESFLVWTLPPTPLIF